MFPQDAATSRSGSSEIDVCDEPSSAASTSSASAAGSYDKYSGLKPINRGISSSSLRSFGQQSHTSSFHGEMAGFAIIEIKDFGEPGKVDDEEDSKEVDLKQEPAAKEPAPPPTKLAQIKRFKMTPCAWASAGLLLLIALIAGVAVVATMGTVKRSSPQAKVLASPSPAAGLSSPGVFRSPTFSTTASFVRLAPPASGYFPDPSFNTAGPIDWYKSNWDSIAMTPRSVARFFAVLAKASRNASLTGRLPLTNATMLLYMRSVEPQYPSVIQAFRNFLMNGNTLPEGSIPSTALPAVIKEAQLLLDASGPVAWIESLNAADSARQALMEGSYLSNLTAAAQAAIRNVTATYPSPPFTPAPLKTRFTNAIASTTGSSGAVTLRPPGFRFFNFLTIPIVVHSLMYVEGANTLQPANAYWSTEPFDRLIAKVNALFDASYTRIRFKLQEVRTDPVLYPYLLVGTYADWQKCASDGPDCISLMAADSNIDPTTTINLWTGGTLARRANLTSCTNCTLGYAWQPPYQFSTPGSNAAVDAGVTSTEAFQQQHVYLNWDVVDSSFMNNEALWHAGAVTAARYLGRHLGLANMLPSCEAPQAVRRTASGGGAGQLSGQGFARADAWCSAARAAVGVGRNPNWKALPAAAPCGAPSLEAMFDIMDPVTPPACALWFNPNSTFSLQALVYKERPIMYSQQSSGSQAP